jgi:hypothetical protein
MSNTTPNDKTTQAYLNNRDNTIYHRIVPLYAESDLDTLKQGMSVNMYEFLSGTKKDNDKNDTTLSSEKKSGVI